jgi:hypothetical protein
LSTFIARRFGHSLRTRDIAAALDDDQRSTRGWIAPVPMRHVACGCG